MTTMTYPESTSTERDLVGIFRIISGDDYDTIGLGDLKIGFIGKNPNHTFEFVPANQMDNPYEQRTAYTSCLFDAFRHIANDLDLAIEFTILVNRKRDTFYGLESK